MTAPQSLRRPQIWLLAARPKTLPAAATPVVIGAALAFADQAAHWPSLVAALLGALLIQIGTNFANDYFDHQQAVDTADRLGPLRMTQAGLVTPQQMRNATILAFSLAFLIGVYLVVRGGWPIVIIGLASILFGVLYTGGPYPLGYNGLGDIFVLIFFGPVAVGGTYYVSAQAITADALIAGLAPGMLSTAILVVNNTRDLPTDRAAGKKTLAVRFGRSFSVAQFGFLVMGAALVPILHCLVTAQHHGAMLASVIVIPGIFLMRTLAQREGEVLNETLADTGKLLALYGVLFSIGWVVRV